MKGEEGTPVVPKKTSRKFYPRALLRALHRDFGYFVVGLTVVYALSGLAVNHIADWDPNFHNFEKHVLLKSADESSTESLSASVLKELAITETPKDVFRASDTELDVTLEHASLHLKKKGAAWEAVYEGQDPRFLLRVSNWLHLNRGKKSWTYVADAYAIILLFLAGSGLAMIKGPKGFVWRGLIVASLGAAVPIGYVVWSKGPSAKEEQPAVPAELPRPPG